MIFPCIGWRKHNQEIRQGTKIVQSASVIREILAYTCKCWANCFCTMLSGRIILHQNYLPNYAIKFFLLWKWSHRIKDPLSIYLLKPAKCIHIASNKILTWRLYIKRKLCLHDITHKKMYLHAFGQLISWQGEFSKVRQTHKIILSVISWKSTLTNFRMKW